jgi:UDP-N-acetylmuramoylalanine--D-glutamate ligase
LELDSWQLQGFGDLKISPNVSVFTNLQDDHLNYYSNNRKLYFSDKANIFRFQKKGDVLIAGREISKLIKKENPPVAPVIPKPLPEKIKLNIRGEHNRENAALAAAAASALGVSGKDIEEGLKSFKPVEGRLQFLRKVRGISIYNDNNATTPDATIMALRALGKKIILICGGTDKGLDMSKLVAEIPRYCKGLVLLRESGTEKIQNSKGKMQKLNSKLKIEDGENLRECVRKAMKSAKKDDIILFSPAFASFGKWFKNEYDRNDQFVKVVEKLR